MYWAMNKRKSKLLTLNDRPLKCAVVLSKLGCQQRWAEMHVHLFVALLFDCTVAEVQRNCSGSKLLLAGVPARAA